MTPPVPRVHRSRLRVEDRLVIVVIVLQCVVRMGGALGGTWLNDDWSILFSLSQRRFVPSELFYVYGGHFFPAQFFLYRVLHFLAPGSYAAAVVVGGLLQALASGLVYLVLRRLFGARPTVVVLLLWFAFSTMTLSSSLWANVAFYMLPFQVAFAASMLLLLRYLEQPSTRRLVFVVASCAAALLCFEKAVMIPVALFAFVAWFPLVSQRPMGPRRALGEHRVLWRALGALLVVYAGCYGTLVAIGHTLPSGVTEFTAGPMDIAKLAARVLVGSFGSSLFGGPWRWTDGVEVGADPSRPMLVLLAFLVGAFVVWTSLRRREAVRAWLFICAWLLVDVAILSLTRLSSYTPGIGGFYRYLADATVPITVLLGFVLLPTRAQREAEATTMQGEQSRDPTPGVLVGVGVAFLMSVAVSYAGAFDAWSSNAGKAYVANARRGFDRVAKAGLLVQDVPAPVLSSLFAPFNTTETILKAIPGHPPFAQSVDRLSALDQEGNIRPARVVGVSSVSGPPTGCGWPITRAPTVVPLRGDRARGIWYVRIRYRAGASTSARVVFGEPLPGETLLPVEFDPGLHEKFLRISGGGHELGFRDLATSGNLCIADVTVGVLEPGRTLLRDTFGGIGKARAFGTTDVRQPWTVLAGTWGVDDGGALLANPDPRGPEVRLEFGGSSKPPAVLGAVALATVTLPKTATSVGVTARTSGVNCGLAVRVRDTEHYWAIVAVPDFATWNILKVRGQSAEIVGNTGLSGASDHSRVTATLGRGSIVVAIDGKTMATVKDTYLGDERDAGIVAYSPGCEAARWGDFVVAG